MNVHRVIVDGLGKPKERYTQTIVGQSIRLITIDDVMSGSPPMHYSGPLSVVIETP